MPGTNVAVLTALAHVIVTEGLVDEAFVRERCDWTSSRNGPPSWRCRRTARIDRDHDRRADPKVLRGAARQFATGGNGAIYYGLGVTEHSQGRPRVMAIANLRWRPAISAGPALA